MIYFINVAPVVEFRIVATLVTASSGKKKELAERPIYFLLESFTFI